MLSLKSSSDHTAQKSVLHSPLPPWINSPSLCLCMFVALSFCVSATKAPREERERGSREKQEEKPVFGGWYENKITKSLLFFVTLFWWDYLIFYWNIWNWHACCCCFLTSDWQMTFTPTSYQTINLWKQTAYGKPSWTISHNQGICLLACLFGIYILRHLTYILIQSETVDWVKKKNGLPT